jgi:hypothetical protein
MDEREQSRGADGARSRCEEDGVLVVGDVEGQAGAYRPVGWAERFPCHDRKQFGQWPTQREHAVAGWRQIDDPDQDPGGTTTSIRVIKGLNRKNDTRCKVMALEWIHVEGGSAWSIICMTRSLITSMRLTAGKRGLSRFLIHFECYVMCSSALGVLSLSLSLPCPVDHFIDGLSRGRFCVFPFEKGSQAETKAPEHGHLLYPWRSRVQ